MINTYFTLSHTLIKASSLLWISLITKESSVDMFFMMKKTLFHRSIHFYG